MRIFLINLLFLFSENSAAQLYEVKSILQVKCIADSSQEYALYLPEGYSTEKRFPVIIFLDPAARGRVPVEKYRLIADEYGVIMAGSCNSQNFDPASSIGSFIMIYNDMIERYAIDTQAIWLSGFSGGSRAAAYLAMNYPQICGVIACGAGFADINDISAKKIKSYAAIVGNKDMNFGEILVNSDYLKTLKVKNIFLEFEGGHVWPPAIQMSLALLWMTDKKDKLNIISERFDSLIWKPVVLKKEDGLLYAAWLETKQLQKIPILSAKAESKATEIEGDVNFITDKISFEKVMEDERKYMNEFSIAFSQLLLQNQATRIEKNFWFEKAERLKKMVNEKAPYNRLSGIRCYDHSIRSCMEYYFQRMSMKDYQKAAAIAEVLISFDPQNSNTHFMMSRAEAGAGNRKGCERKLKDAIKKGLTFSKRIEKDELLLKVLSEEQLKKLFIKK